MMISFACGHRASVTLKSVGAAKKSAEAFHLSMGACRSCCEPPRDDAPGYSVDYAGREVYDSEAAAQAYDRAEAKRAAAEAEEFTADDYAREELSDAAVSDAYHGSSDRGTPWHLYKGFGGSL